MTNHIDIIHSANSVILAFSDFTVEIYAHY